MSRNLIPQIRPFICKECRTRARPTASWMAKCKTPPTLLAPLRQISRPYSTNLNSPEAILDSPYVKERIERLGGLETIADYFPRLSKDPQTRTMDVETLLREGENLEKDSTRNSELVQIHGRISSIRHSGKALLFLDIQDGKSIMMRSNTLEKSTHPSACLDMMTGQVVLKIDAKEDERRSAFQNDLQKFVRLIQRGDWINIRGYIHKTKRGQVSILAAEIPKLIAPSLQPLPLEIDNIEFLVRHRHVYQMIHPFPRHTIETRSAVLQAMRVFFFKEGFLEVSTPLIVANAGGAAARPFETIATEFSDLKLKLRVAPELFLKRLVIGNAAKVFEIGPAFRNEGVDATHNPEFTICEFYERMATLPLLMAKTKRLFDFVSQTLTSRGLFMGHTPEIDPENSGTAMLSKDAIQLDSSYKTIEFIPELEKAIRKQLSKWSFPDLANTQSSLENLSMVCSRFKIRIPLKPTIPNLLDSLCAHFLESKCYQPTWIIHHPECLSPLAKSFEYISPNGTSHAVAARAELFINHAEYVNCYEEENSPVEQRRKFQQQIALHTQSPGTGNIHIKQDPIETHQTIDENYLEALEWGMPPTGGWGCGVDRLVMFFTGAERIADVLSFGNLRNVVGLRSATLSRKLHEEESE